MDLKFSHCMMSSTANFAFDPAGLDVPQSPCRTSISRKKQHAATNSAIQKHIPPECHCHQISVILKGPNCNLLGGNTQESVHAYSIRFSHPIDHASTSLTNFHTLPSVFWLNLLRFYFYNFFH